MSASQRIAALVEFHEMIQVKKYSKSILPSSRENVSALLLNLKVFVDGHGGQVVVGLEHLVLQPCTVAAHARG